jgi:hypothetical protein
MAKGSKAAYTVSWPIARGEQVLQPGETVELTEDEAKTFGMAVSKNPEEAAPSSAARTRTSKES